jgi:hypothetical protein
VQRLLFWLSSTPALLSPWQSRSTSSGGEQHSVLRWGRMPDGLLIGFCLLFRLVTRSPNSRLLLTSAVDHPVPIPRAYPYAPFDQSRPAG